MAARKKADADPPPVDTAPTPVPPEEPAVNPPVTPEPASDTNGNGDIRKPLKMFGYQVARETYVQASIWERVVTLADGSTFTTHDVSVRKRFRDQQTGDWKSSYSFRGSELYAVCHALSQASTWILEARANAANCPF